MIQRLQENVEIMLDIALRSGFEKKKGNLPRRRNDDDGGKENHDLRTEGCVPIPISPGGRVRTPLT
jgi:hypothetical protein